MAESITATPGINRFTLGAINVATEVTLPGITNVFTVRFEGTAGRLALSGVDGGALGADYVTIDADSFFELRLDSGADRVSGLSVFLDSNVAGAVVVQTVAEE